MARHRRLTYVLSDGAGAGGAGRHVAGVNALLLQERGASDGGAALYTASRDSSIRRWDLRGGAPRAAGCLAQHTDWVNALALFEMHDVLVSASSDTSVRAWRAGSSEGQCLGTARGHADYVMAIAAAAKAPRFATAGLRGEAFVWDLNTLAVMERRGSGRTLGGGGAGSKDPSPLLSMGHAESCYAVAMDGAGKLVATGSTDNVVRLWDAREANAKPMLLTGHQDNVRFLLLNADGTMALSGGSDATVRLWDLRQRRCSQTLAVHSDSVWALVADPNWTSVISGGRDGRCVRTDLRTRESAVVFESEHPISALAVERSQAGVWAAGPTSSVHKWFLSSPGRGRSNSFVAGTSPMAAKQAMLASSAGSADGHGARCRSSADGSAEGGGGMAPIQRSPAATIAGGPGIVKYQALADRRRVLTANSEGEVALWDIIRGLKTDSFGKVDFDGKLKEIDTKDVVTMWFALDARLGALAIHLDCPQCFRAECYSVDLGLGGEDDQRVCPGDIVLRSLLARWVAERKHGSRAGSRRGSRDKAGGKASAQQQQQQQQQQQGSPELMLDTLVPAAAVVTTDASGSTWRRGAADLSADFVRDDAFPPWVMDCVLRGTYPVPANQSLKCGFRLLPHEGSNLAPIPNPKLNAPRILRMRKILKYVAGKQAFSESEATRPPEELLEVLCAGKVLPLEFSLAAARAHAWKRPEDIIITYRRKRKAG